ncbi:MAG: c-type cytochrome [Isosphaeraceae bacterium]|nr:c-type cytochrome [Isosphaeraceae bacterium]
MPFLHARWAFVAALGITVAGTTPIPARADADAPRAIAAWPAGLMEVRVAFDRPVRPGIEKALVGKTIRVDESAQRLNGLRAPSAPPSLAKQGPAIAAARLENGGKLLVLATDPHSRPAVYYLALPGPTQDIPYDLSGVDVTWDAGGDDPKPAWTGWWPDLSPESTRAATRGSVEHERGLAFLSKPGRLTLRTLLALPQGKVIVRLASSQPIAEAVLGGESGEPKSDATGESVVEFPLEATNDPIDLTVTIQTRTGAKPFALKATYHTESSPPQPLRPGQLSVPWAPGTPPAPATPPAPPDLAGGDPKRGEALFFGETAKCANCHQIRSKGGKVGPDLTDVFRRPAAEVYRDIAEPSAVIRTDFIPYTLALKDGRVLAGIVRAEGADAVRLTDTEAKATVIARAEIEDLRPSATSVMPVGLVGAIGEANMRDLIAFLMRPNK